MDAGRRRSEDMSWFRRKRFVILLVVLLLLIVTTPALRGTVAARIVSDVALTSVFVAGFWAVYTERRRRTLALALGIPALIGLWTGYVVPDLPRVPLAVTLHLVAALFFGLTITVILGAIFRQRAVSADGICGALCAYLMVGLTFGHLYCSIKLAAPGSFRGIGDHATDLGDDRQLYALLTYFSFVTLSTVGYGDITPGSGLTRGLAMVEAVIGQFYVAVLIAGLVGMRLAQTLAGRRDSPA